MASSYIEFKDKGEWFYDAYLENSLHYLIKAIEINIPQLDWIQDYLLLLKNNSLGMFAGWMHLEFDKYFSDIEKKEIFIEYINQAIIHLESKYPLISKEELNSFVSDVKLQGEWQKDVSPKMFIDVLEKLKNILTS